MGISMRALGLALAAMSVFGQIPSQYDNCPAAVQELMQSLLTKYNLSGLQIAVAPNGVLTCAGALGYADSTIQRPMTPTTLMRIGSVSKTITGMAIAKLFEDARLGLDDKALDYVKDLQPANGPTDIRWRNVTIRHLLQHSMGWDRALGNEPIQNTVNIATALGIRAPATSTDVIRWMLRQPLHFEPGTKASYTGVEYAFLAIIVERASGMPFERYVSEAILAPAGIRSSMRVGRTLREGGAFPDEPALAEAAYFSPLAPSPSVFPYVSGTVPRPYGEWYNEALEGSGGWTANAPALLRYVNKMFGRGATTALFKPETIREIQAKPSYEPADATFWYGLGWQIVPAANGVTVVFSGNLRGTIAHVRFLPNGNSYAFITNSSTNDDTAALADIASQLNQRIGPLGIGGNNLFNTAKYRDSTTPLPAIQPQKGVVHAASSEPGVTVGSWLTIHGWDLAETTRTWNTTDFKQGNKLPTSLDGIEVQVDGEPAAMYYVSPTLITALVPNLATTGTSKLRVFRNGIAGHPEPIEIRPSAPEYFRYFAGSSAYALAVHRDGSVVADPTVVPGLKPAAAGETILIFGSGFAPAPAGALVKTVTPTTAATVTIGTASATILFTGLTSTGLFQVQAVVPRLPPGDYPVSLSVNGVPNLARGILPIR